MPFVNSTTGRDPSINDVKPAPWRRLKANIELAADVTISLTSFDDEDFGKGWCAVASKQTHHAYAGGMTSRTVMSVWDDGPFLALDQLAAKLGVPTDDEPDSLRTQRAEGIGREAMSPANRNTVLARSNSNVEAV